MRFSPRPKRWDNIETLEETDTICWCVGVDKATIVRAVNEGAATLSAIKSATGACTGDECAQKNPNKRCCSKEIKALIARYGSPKENGYV